MESKAQRIVKLLVDTGLVTWDEGDKEIALFLIKKILITNEVMK